MMTRRFGWLGAAIAATVLCTPAFADLATLEASSTQPLHVARQGQHLRILRNFASAPPSLPT